MEGWGRWAAGWAVTLFGVLAVGIVAVADDWRPLSATGWILIVVYLGLRLGRRRQDPDEVTHCAFCGKRRMEVAKLIHAPDGTAICDECVSVCVEVLQEAAVPHPTGPLPEDAQPLPEDPWQAPEGE